MNHYFIYVMLLFSSSLMTPLTHAADIEVVTEYMSPFQLQNEDGTLGGYATDVVSSLFEVTGDKANIIVMPWARAYKRSLEHKNVMIFSLAQTKPRQNLFNWIGLLASENYQIWGLREHFPTTTGNLDWLKQHTFVVNIDSEPQNILLQLGFTNLFSVSSQEQIFNMLLKNRADFTLSSASYIQFQTQNLGIDVNVMNSIHQFEEYKSELYVAFNIDSDQALVEQYRHAFLALISNGKLHELKQKWQIK